MIQRIQSLYLFIAFAAYITLLFLPVALFQTADLLFSFGNIISGAGASVIINPYMLIVLVAMACLVLVTIFIFKKRILQIRMTTVALLLNVLYVGGLFFFVDSLEKQYSIAAAYEPGMYISLIPLVFLVLASRAIRKDENLVRSTDRLR
jgi:hypothetical protein